MHKDVTYYKRMIKLSTHPKTDSCVLNSTKESNDSKRSKIKNEKIVSTTSLMFAKSTNSDHRAYKSSKEHLLPQNNIDKRLKFREILQKSGNFGEKTQGQQPYRYILWTDESQIELYLELNRQN